MIHGRDSQVLIPKRHNFEVRGEEKRSFEGLTLEEAKQLGLQVQPVVADQTRRCGYRIAEPVRLAA